MLRSSTTRSNWIGAPLIGMDRRMFEESLLKRFPPPATEQAVGYIERVTDRQVSKARGLLIFNAVLFVILGFAGAKGTASLTAANLRDENGTGTLRLSTTTSIEGVK